MNNACLKADNSTTYLENAINPIVVHAIASVLVYLGLICKHSPFKSILMFLSWIALRIGETKTLFVFFIDKKNVAFQEQKAFIINHAGSLKHAWAQPQTRLVHTD